MHLWYSPLYTDALDPTARFPRERYRLVKARLDEGNEGPFTFHEAPPIETEDLCLAHDEDYVAAFLEGTLSEEKIRRIGLRPWTERIVERTLVLTNGSVEATRHVLSKGGVAGNLGGGTHHAYRDFGSGYCIFNDLAIAARLAQRDFGVGRVLILDLDVHQGDGTAAIFEDDPSVRTVSVHCERNFPFRKTRSDLDVGLPEGAEDAEYLDRLERILDSESGPDLLLYQAGVDPLAEDRLGHLRLSRIGLRRRNEMVFSFAQSHGLPVVVTMGGGYAEPIDASADAHADLFRQAAVADRETQIS